MCEIRLARMRKDDKIWSVGLLVTSDRNNIGMIWEQFPGYDKFAEDKKESRELFSFTSCAFLLPEMMRRLY